MLKGHRHKPKISWCHGRICFESHVYYKTEIVQCNLIGTVKDLTQKVLDCWNEDVRVSSLSKWGREI